MHATPTPRLRSAAAAHVHDQPRVDHLAADADRRADAGRRQRLRRGDEQQVLRLHDRADGPRPGRRCGRSSRRRSSDDPDGAVVAVPAGAEGRSVRPVRPRPGGARPVGQAPRPAGLEAVGPVDRQDPAVGLHDRHRHDRRDGRQDERVSRLADLQDQARHRPRPGNRPRAAAAHRRDLSRRCQLRLDRRPDDRQCARAEDSSASSSSSSRCRPTAGTTCAACAQRIGPADHRRRKLHRGKRRRPAAPACFTASTSSSSSAAA